MTTVGRRCVFYVGGFDPKGAAHYHRLYADESARQAATTGAQRSVGPRRKLASGNACWEVRAQDGGQAADTHYEFMRWDDVVRRHWPKTTLALWRDVVASSLFYLLHGAWWRMFCLAWPPAIAVLMPFVLVCVLCAGIPAAALGAGWWVAAHTGQAGAGVLAGLLLAGGLWLAGRRIEARYSMYWMMRSYAFTARQARGEVPDLEQRLDELAQMLAERLRAGQDDEVLVVGHSSGAIMAAIVVARALRTDPDLLRGRSSLALLTLGQWIPLLSLLPMATRFRDELAVLGAARGLVWTDFSAPPDGCCFALTHPLRSCGIQAPAEGATVKLLNPRFAKLFGAAAYAALKRDKFRLHFQYLHSAELPGAYDYFAITSGALTLAARYAQDASVEDFRTLQPLRR